MAHPKRAEAEPRLVTSLNDDGVAWSLELAAHLRRQDWAKLDIPNLIDAVEDVARAQRHALTSALSIILLQRLKWDRRPSHRSRSWATPIRLQRLAVQERIEDSPSLGGSLADLLARAYHRARIEAAAETNLPGGSFPETCPYSVVEALHRDVSWPPTGSEKAPIPS